MSLSIVESIVESATNVEQETFNRPVICHSDPCGKLNIWVRLSHPLSPFCYSEALLLCQNSDTSWIAWIPDYGEATLRRGQFWVNE